jgi:hypothetical protein
VAKRDYAARRAQDAAGVRPPERSVRAGGPGVSPTRSRKRYPTEAQAQNAARYVNEWGQQRARYEWLVRPADDGQAFELWRRPRGQPGRMQPAAVRTERR